MRDRDRETIDHQAGLIEQQRQKNRELAGELQLARDLLAAIGDVATLPLPLKGEWDAFDRENRTRMPAIRGAAQLGCVGQLPATLRAEIRALRRIATAPFSYTPSPAALPKPPLPESDAERAAAIGGGVLVPKFTPHPPGRISSTSADAIPLCDCPQRDGRVYHDRETCTDPLVAKLDWFASRPPAAGVAPTIGGPADICLCGDLATKHDLDAPHPCTRSACGCAGFRWRPPAAIADVGEHQSDELAAGVDDAEVVDEPARCESCQRVPGMPTAPCRDCPDYKPGWTFAQSGSETL